MERFSFGDDVAFVPRGDLLDGVRTIVQEDRFAGLDRLIDAVRPAYFS